jgi:hypothetical protein
MRFLIGSKFSYQRADWSQPYISMYLASVSTRWDIPFSIGISRGSAAAFLAQLRGSRAFAASQAARRLNETGREYMWDGTLSPMGESLSLLSYGNALRRSQGSSFRFYWSDDGKVLSWGGELWGQLIIVFDVGEVGHRGSILIRGASAVYPTPLTGHSR